MAGSVISFEADVRAFHGGRCAGCGSTDRTRVRLIVPLEAGGKKVLSNGTVVCRTCEFGEIRERQEEPSPNAKKLLNVWVSEELHAWIQTHIPFQGASALARYLIELYLSSDSVRYDDLHLYQDPTAAVRCFVYVPAAMHTAFKARATRDGFTLTQALIGLIILYRIEVAREGRPHHE